MNDFNQGGPDRVRLFIFILFLQKTGLTEVLNGKKK